MTMPPMLEDEAIAHAILEQFEGRANGSSVDFRYDGQAWYGTDDDKVLIKSEGQTGLGGKFTDGQHELLYDRAVSTYFDLQAGVRLDLDSGPARAWAALGIQGLAIDFFEVEATAYVSDRGVAGRLKGSYDLPFTQRLILQPEAEINFYSAADKARGNVAGLSDIDAGLRLRYEFTRKFAPYLGVSYQGRFGQSRFGETDCRDSKSDVRLAFGIRAWL
jgi:copper resistance protein B